MNAVSAVLRVVHARAITIGRPRIAVTASLTAVCFAVLVSVLTVLKAQPGPQQDVGDGEGVTIAALSTAGGMATGFTNAAVLTGIVVLVVFLTTMTGDHEHGTVRGLLTRGPGRLPLLAGTYVTLALATAALLAVAEIAAVVAAYLAAPAAGVDRGLWLSADGLRAAGTDYGRVLLACVLLGSFGALIGVAARRTALGVALAVGWLLPVENMIGRAWDGAAAWFPGLLARAVATGGTEVSSGHAQVTAGAWIVVCTAVTAVLFARRDVTA